MRFHADRSDPRSAAAVRDAERLVQVQVRHVAAEFARLAQPDHRVHVGAVDIDLAAVRMHDVADFADRFLEYTVRRWISDHQRGQIGRVLVGFRLQVGDIDIAAFVAAHHHHLHAGHVRGRRIGAVRRARNQADVAQALAAALVIGANREQARVLALRAGVRLQRHRVVAGADHQHLFQFGNELLITLHLVERRERMDVAEFLPGHRNHLGRRVQLHRAGTERNHRAVERQILVGQLAQITQHLGLGMMGVEYRMRQEAAGARERGRNAVDGGSLARGERWHGEGTAENRPQRFDIGLGGGFVERDADRLIVHRAQVDRLLARRGVKLGAAIAGAHRDSVEEGGGAHFHIELAQSFGQRRCQTMHALRDRLQSLRAMIDRIHARHIGQQDLRGTHIGSRLLAADMLFARLQREAVCLVAMAVDRHANHAARHQALVGIPGRQVSGMRAAVAERHAEALRRADRDVGAEFARRRQHGEREQVGRHHDQRVLGMRLGHGVGVVMQLAIQRRILQQHAEAFQLIEARAMVAHHHLDADRRGARAHDIDGLRKTVLRHEESLALALRQPLAERHRFRRGGRFVQQGCIGDFHAGQVRHHGLEIQQCLQPALRNLRLIRCVGGVPSRIFKQVAQDDGRGMAIVVAHPDIRFEHLVFGRDLVQLVQHFRFGAGVAQRERLGRQDRRRHHFPDEGIHRIEPERRQHGFLIGLIRPDVSADKVGMLLQIRKGGAFLIHGDP